MYSKWRHPPEDRFPPDHIVDLEEAAMGWVLRLAYLLSLNSIKVEMNSICSKRLLHEISYVFN